MSKKLITGKPNKAGRSHGKISIRHRGGGHKRKYRKINFKRQQFDRPATILKVEYDPNRSANVVLVEYEDGEKDYFLAPQKVKPGQKIVSSEKKVPLKPGNRTLLTHLPIGTNVYNVANMVRAAGTNAILQGIEGKYAQLKMPSKEIRLVEKDKLATIGQVSNPEHQSRKLRKAGQKRWLGWRPTVRGTAMPAGEHPHGGGEGRTGTGGHPKTPWGKPAVGKTRKKHKKSNRLIIKRRK